MFFYQFKIYFQTQWWRQKGRIIKAITLKETKKAASVIVALLLFTLSHINIDWSSGFFFKKIM
jgi:hypothetical protein